MGNVVGRRIKTEDISPFKPPIGTDAITVEYPDNITEIYRFRSGGTSGGILASITITYTAANKNFIASVVES